MWNFVLSIVASALLAILPSSTNYKLEGFGFGSGGTANSTSTNFKLNGVSGEVSNNVSSSTNFKANNGFNHTIEAHVPIVTLTNPSNFYNKLTFTLNNQSNATDATFVLQISTDNFVADTTHYIQADLTIGTTKLYQNYAAWGSGGNQNVVGLIPLTTYYLRAAAFHSNFTESAYGPIASVATVNVNFSYSLSPSTVDIGNLSPGTVGTSPSVTMNIDTNADNGASVWISGLNAGLRSTSANFTIAAVTGDLASLGSGFGIQVASVTQTSGGPLAKASPYNGASNNVGIVDSTFRTIFTSVGPITAGVGTLVGQAKSTSVTPAAIDYKEVLTMVAAGSF